MSEEANARIAERAQDAYFARVRAAADAASANPDDLYENRKAVAMATHAVKRVSSQRKEQAELPEPTEIVRWTEGAQSNLRAAPTGCATNLEVAELYIAAKDYDSASVVLTDSAERCGSVRALERLARVLKWSKRCDDLQPLARKIWPSANSDEQIPVLDAVATCSTAVNLRPNLLAFASPSVVEDYFALLDRRAYERAKSECRSSCYSALDSCNYSCWGGRCGCDAVYDLCVSRCR